MTLIRSLRAVLLCSSAAALPGADGHLGNLTKAVSEFRLANGVQFFVVERPQSPLIAFHLRVKAGVADEPAGQGGVSLLALVNFLDGSEIHGTKNLSQERAALAEATKLLAATKAEEAKADQADEIKKGRADYQARAAFDRAAQLGVGPRFYDTVLEQNGVSGFEVRTGADFSDLALTLPSNRAELWFRMMGSWISAPSPRFFYQSRTLVSEQRTQASKTGVWQRERAFGGAFTVHPYRAIGAPDTELTTVTADEVQGFLKAHYRPSNLTIGIVGDITPVEARRLAEFYFGKIPAVAPAEPRGATPLKAEGIAQTRLALPEPPMYAAAWPRPAGNDADDAVFEMLQAVMGGGPGSRIHNELMVDAQLARRLSVTARYPGGRYPGLFLIEAEPLPTRAYEDVEAAINKALETIGKSGVTAEELERARQWWRGRVLAESLTAASRAQQLVRSFTESGTYKVEERLAQLEKVTSKDCQRVVGEYLAGKPYFSVIQLTAVDGEAQ